MDDKKLVCKADYEAAKARGKYLCFIDETCCMWMSLSSINMYFLHVAACVVYSKGVLYVGLPPSSSPLP